VALDTAQYQMDMNALAAAQAGPSAPEDVYATFNMIMRRKAKENNFKAVLESIRDLVNEDCVLPPWLHDILLGYGDPGAAQYSHMDGCLQTVDFKDTFLDAGEGRYLLCAARDACLPQRQRQQCWRAWCSRASRQMRG
jgi:intron-binding protein aquarius